MQREQLEQEVMSKNSRKVERFRIQIYWKRRYMKWGLSRWDQLRRVLLGDWTLFRRQWEAIDQSHHILCSGCVLHRDAMSIGPSFTSRINLGECLREGTERGNRDSKPLCSTLEQQWRAPST